MNYKIDFAKDVRKFLQKCDIHIAKSFYEKVRILSYDPQNLLLDIEPLK